MKLGNSYRLRVISNNTDDICILTDDCMGFLRSLVLSEETEKDLEKIEKKLRETKSMDNIDKMYKYQKDILFQDIFDILKNIAPEGCYFGNHPVDSKLIGFWDKALFSATR